MKLFGSIKKSRHTHAAAEETSSSDSPKAEKPREKRKKLSGKTKLMIATCTVAAVLVVMAASAVIFVKFHMKPPDVTSGLNNPNRPGDTAGSTGPAGSDQPDQPNRPNQPDDTDPVDPSGAGTSDPTQSPQQDIRPEGVYTVLIAVRDVAGANTDALMVAKFDTRDYTLKAVSIPRDTLVNVSYRSKKVNAMYAYGGTDGLVEGITDLIGFQPDFYAVVKLRAVQKLIDDIGGVDYYVPQNMDYDDDAQNLHIHFTKGMTHMTGQKAVEYMRFRKGYADADIGRIDAQHEFLITMAKQILANTSKVNITSLVDIFLNDVKTDLDVGECTWLAKELLKMDAENVSFYTMPGIYNDYVKDRGYVTVKLDEWIAMLNETINPFNISITADNLDVIYRDGKKIHCTTGVYADKDWASGLS